MTTLDLPDTAVLNDPGHIDDHNKIVTALGALNAGKAEVAHATAHAAAGADPVTLAESQVTGLTAALAAKIPASTLDANTVLYAVTDNTPAALAVPASSLVGRAASGNVAALTVAEVRTLVGTTRVTRPLTDDLRVETYDATHGWVTTRYDSGRRDVTASMSNLDASNTGTVRVRRINHRITWEISNLLMAAGTGTATLWAAIPQGFRGDSPGFAASYLNRNNSQIYAEFMAVNATSLAWLSEMNITTGAGTTTRPSVGITGQLSYDVIAAYPSVLPGTLVTQAPA